MQEEVKQAAGGLAAFGERDQALYGRVHGLLHTGEHSVVLEADECGKYLWANRSAC